MPNERIGDWCQTLSNRQAYAWDMRPEEVCIEDIARGLLQPRFACQTRRDCPLYTVAEHCVRASLVGPEETALARLLHDAHEWLFRDLPAPVRRHPAMAGFNAGCEALQIVINRACGLADDAHRQPSVVLADLTMLATEKRDLMPEGGAKWRDLPPPLAGTIMPWTAERAEEWFLARFHDLGGRDGSAR